MPEEPDQLERVNKQMKSFFIHFIVVRSPILRENIILVQYCAIRRQGDVVWCTWLRPELWYLSKILDYLVNYLIGSLFFAWPLGSDRVLYYDTSKQAGRKEEWKNERLKEWKKRTQNVEVNKMNKYLQLEK